MQFRGVFPRSLRYRISAAFIGGTLLVTGVLAASTYALSRDFLVDRERESLRTDMFDGLRDARDFMANVESDLEPDEYRAQVSELVNLLSAGRATDSSRAVVVSIQLEDQEIPEFIGSSLGLTQAQPIPILLRLRVGQSATVWSTTTSTILFGEGTTRALVLGGEIPGTGVNGVPSSELYMFASLESADAAASGIARILALLVFASAFVAAFAGSRLAARTIEPLRRASEAARQVAAGRLDYRLESHGNDELASMAASFNAMAEALEKRIERERQFVSDASHELRTPLTGLKNSVDMVVMQGDALPPKIARVAQLAADEVRSLQRLVDDLLELTRAEAGSVGLHTEEVDLAAFAVEVSRRRAPDAEIVITAPPAGLIVNVDKQRLERIVGNLLENAVVHGGGDVEVVVANRDAGPRVVVADRGPGISPEQLERIFERFWRGDTSRRRGQGSGSGLGLAIAKENAVLLSATLNVDSTPGRGTRFILDLPKEVLE